MSRNEEVIQFYKRYGIATIGPNVNRNRIQTEFKYERPSALRKVDISYDSKTSTTSKKDSFR